MVLAIALCLSIASIVQSKETADIVEEVKYNRENEHKDIWEKVKSIETAFNEYQIQNDKKVEMLQTANTEKDSIIASQGMLIKKLSITVTELQVNTSELSTHVQELEFQLNETTHQLTDTQAKLDVVSGKANQTELQLSETTQHFKSSLEKLEASTRENVTKLSKLHSQLVTHVANNATKLERIAKKLDQLETTASNNNAEIRNCISDLSNKVNDVQQSTNDIKTKVQELKEQHETDIDNLSNQIKTAVTERASLSDKVTETKKLTESYEQRKAMRSPASSISGSKTIRLSCIIVATCVGYLISVVNII